MSGGRIPPVTLEGWWALHQFLRLSPGNPHGSGTSVGDDLAATLADWADLGDEGWSGLYRLVGGGGDFLMLHFRSTLRALGEVEGDLRAVRAYQRFTPTGHYVSVVEMSLYEATRALLAEAREAGFEPHSERWEERVRAIREEEAASPYARRRLHPRQPEDMPYVSFYRMDRRRGTTGNWYATDVDERARLVAEHSATGRRYRGRVSQVISGSVGLDDHEWGVTLFATDPAIFKELVTEMRYDEATALYADFGQFRVGHRIEPAELAAELRG